MAYDANGFWKYEDDDTAKQVAKVVDAGGPLMKQARGIGQMVSQSRGLGNSTLAVGAAHGAVLDKATQIGGQQSAQMHGKNLQRQSDVESYKRSMDVTGLQESGANTRAQMQISSAEAMLAKEIASKESMLGRELTSREKMAEADRLASRENLGMELTSREGIAGMQETGAMQRQILQSTASLEQQRQADEAAYTRQSAELQSRTDISAADRAAEQARLDATIAANRQNSLLDANVRLNLGEMDRAQSAQNAALGSMTTIQTAHMQAMAHLMSNAEIPAEARASYERSIQAATEANVGLVEQITGLNLAWGNNPAAPPPAPAPQRLYLPA